MLRKIENFHNYLSDTHYVWFPFLFLKLKPEQELTLLHMAKMTFCFGAYFGLMLHIPAYFQTGELVFESVLMSVLKGVMIFAAWFNIVTRPLWNRRVKRMASQS